MEDIDLVHTPGHHPLLPVPKELNVRPPRANAHAAGILKQMMADAPVAEDQVLDIAAGFEKSPKEKMTLLCSSTPCSPAKQITSVPSAPDDIIDSPAGTETIKAVLPSPAFTPKASGASTPAQTEEDVLSNGCDLPIPKPGKGYVPKVDLSSGLSSLSPQHPTRVWNSLLHACRPEHQPFVQWQYISRNKGYLAEMTVTLPAEHPIIKALARGYTLPQNAASPEHKAAVRRLGGEKRWKGQTKRLKAEAQNDAVRQCIADNGLLWANYEVMSTVEPGYYLGDQAARLRDGRPMLLDPNQPSEQALKRPTEDGHMSGRSLRPKLTRTMDSSLKTAENNATSEHWHSGGIKPLAVAKGEDATGDRQLALQGDARPAPSTQPGQVDWQQQLSSFCHEAGMPVPKYYQRIERRQGASTLFFGKVTVEHDHFESDKGFVKLRDARQEVARLVFCEHFGQDP